MAKLEPPKDGKTSWDFSLIDPIVLDFFAAAEGRPILLSFSTLPPWMFRAEKPVAYPADPDEITWNYGGGSELRDPLLKEVVNYYHRLASWYMKGGFYDECGKWHESGHRIKVAYWEVLNEIDMEHELPPPAVHGGVRRSGRRFAEVGPRHEVQRPGTGRAERPPGIHSVLSGSKEPSARYPAGPGFVPLLCRAGSG